MHVLRPHTPLPKKTKQNNGICSLKAKANCCKPVKDPFTSDTPRLSFYSLLR